MLTTKLKDVADAIREKTKKENLMKLEEMPAEIRSIPTGGGGGGNYGVNLADHCDADGNWIRPDGWPDLDSLNPGKNELFMTVDNSGKYNQSFVSMSGSGRITYEIGQIVDGEFVASESRTITTAAIFSRYFDETDPAFPVVHVKGEGDIKTFGFQTSVLQPIVERIGHVYSGKYAANNNAGSFNALRYLERDKTAITTLSAATDLQYWYSNCYNLQAVDFSTWDTSDFTVRPTALTSMFENCQKIRKLDLSPIDSSNWAVTNVSYMFRYCYSLRELKLMTKTSNWAVTNGSNTFMYCTSLEDLDLSGLDCSNWSFSTAASLANTFEYCTSLKSINVSGLRFKTMTSNCAYILRNCYSLRDLDLSGIDLSTAAITSTANLLHNAYGLKSADLSGIDWSKVTTVGSSSGYIGAKNLEAVKFGANNSGKLRAKSLYFGSQKLTKASIDNLIDLIADVTGETGYRFMIDSELIKILTDDQEAAIAAKGWTIG